MKRGEVWIANLGRNGVGSEQLGARPVLIIQNDLGNEFSPTVIVAAITDISKRPLPTHLKISKDVGVMKDSTILLEQIRTIDKTRLKRKLSTLSPSLMKYVDNKLKISFGLVPVTARKLSELEGGE